MNKFCLGTSEATVRYSQLGSYCGAVGRAVTSDTRGPPFKSRHGQIFNLCTVNCIEKTIIKKAAGNGPILFKKNCDTTTNAAHLN